MRKLSVPQHTLIHTLFAIGYGGILLVWLSTESNHPGIVSALGSGLACVVVGLSVLRRFGGRELRFAVWGPGLVVAGLLAGLCSVIGTALLMLMKNAQHSHVMPDFSGEVVVGILGQTPAWVLAGGLIGGALTLVLLATYRQGDPDLNSTITGEHVETSE
jgi:hypothetical protein